MPPPSQNGNYYEEMASKWAEEYQSSSSLDEVWGFYRECGYKNPAKTLQDMAGLVPWSKNRILDFGCDTALMLRFFCDQAPSLKGAGVDINHDAIAKARQNFPEFDLRTFDGLHIPYDDKTFDMVIAIAVIKHVRYADRAFVYDEISRVSDHVLFVEIDAKEEEESAMQGWTFYHSNFEEEFKKNFEPVKVVHEAGDIVGLYRCR